MKLLLTGAFSYTDEQLSILKNSGFEITFVQDECTELSIDVSEFDAVVCNNLFKYNDPEKFSSLKAVQLTSAGFDRVPVGYFASHSISLFNAKGVYSVPMAEWVILKVLEIYKNSAEFYKQQKKKIWEKHRDLQEINGKTVLIAGVGSVGCECAKRFQAFGAKVLGADLFDSKSPYVNEFIHIDNIKDALRRADITVLTLPLNKSTENLFSENLLSIMKDDSILINVSRGGIINEEDLITQMKNGKFSGVALDVFEEEPLSAESPLWTLPRLLITPHNSFVSDGTAERMFNLIYKNLTEFDFGKKIS